MDTPESGFKLETLTGSALLAVRNALSRAAIGSEGSLVPGPADAPECVADSSACHSD